MSFRTSVLPALDFIRKNVRGPTGLDISPTLVQILQITWSGALRNSGTPTTKTIATLPAGTKVRHVNEREIANSGGRYEQGDVAIGPITPTYGPSPIAPSGGGFSEAQLDPPITTQGIENVYRLSLQTGANNSGISGDYALVDFKRDRALHYTLIVRRRRTTP